MINFVTIIFEKTTKGYPYMRIVISVLLFIFFSSIINGQTNIPNGDFNNWTDNKPDGWDASNFVYGPFTLQTVFQDTVFPISGSACVRVETRTFNLVTAQPTIPGVLTLGQIIVDMNNFTGHVAGGVPFTGRPKSLKGAIHAEPETGDSAMVAVGFSKWNGSSRDTIGYGQMYISNPQIEWIPFVIPIDFTSSEMPDSMNIVISSSAIEYGIIASGSKLRIDNLVFDYGDIHVAEEFFANDFRVWADSYKNLHYDFSGENEQLSELTIYDINGNTIRKMELVVDNSTGKIGVQDLAAGVYIIVVITDKNRYYSRKVIIQ